jgi:two-component system, sensor histidine kinase and response regulator
MKYQLVSDKPDSNSQYPHNKMGNSFSTTNNIITALYVEDNPLNQELAKQIFDNLGYDLTVANDGQEALELIIQERFDIIFMDINMPRMNGYETTNVIRKRLCLKVPIIALTTCDTESDIEHCKLAGMNYHISKPLNEPKLSAVILKYRNRR